jgi:hypothetical protein
MSILRVILVATLGLSAFAQAPAKPRVFITDSYFWETLNSQDTPGDVVTVSRRGKTTLQISKIVSDFRKRCPDFTVTAKKETADYVLVMEQDDRSTKSYVVLDKEGDTLGSGSTMLMSTAMKEICKVLGEAQSSLAEKNQNP